MTIDYAYPKRKILHFCNNMYLFHLGIIFPI